jgi:hypothetical protein
MRAENLLFILDECDELQLLLRESVRPGAIGVLILLMAAALVSWATSSFALGVVTLVAGAWVSLCIAWVNERVVPATVATSLNRRRASL